MIRTTGIRCHIGCSYIGALSYADDITLLRRSIRELSQRLQTAVQPVSKPLAPINGGPIYCFSRESRPCGSDEDPMDGWHCSS